MQSDRFRIIDNCQKCGKFPQTTIVKFRFSQVICKCGIETEEYDTMKEAINAWNNMQKGLRESVTKESFDE